LKPGCAALNNGDVVVYPGCLHVGRTYLVIDEPVMFKNIYVEGCTVVAIDNPTNECFNCDGLTFPYDLEDYGGEECIPAWCARLGLLDPGVSISDERFAGVHIVEYLELRQVDSTKCSNCTYEYYHPHIDNCIRCDTPPDTTPLSIEKIRRGVSALGR